MKKSTTPPSVITIVWIVITLTWASIGYMWGWNDATTIDKTWSYSTFIDGEKVTVKYTLIDQLIRDHTIN